MVNLRNNKTDSDGDDKGERLASLDATRGVFLLLLVSSGFGVRNPEMLDQARWAWITNQWAHRTWEGCTLWDLLQPAFLFFVGLAMPYSYTNRQAKGQGWPRQFLHALKRSALLILLGLYLDSYHARHLVFDLRGDLQQIGLAYLLAFLVLPLGMPVQGATVAFLLIGHTAAYVIYSFAGGHDLWNASQNFGVFIDQCLRFSAHREHLVTFNAFSSAGIVLLGMLTSGLIRSGLTQGTKVAIMTACSFVGILFGWLLSGGNGWVEFHWYAVIPLIKRLETWTFVFMSVSWTLLIFTYFYLLIDGIMLRAWAVPLILVGRNSLFVFVTFQLFREWAATTALLVLPASPPIAVTLRPLFVELLVILLFWLVCFWLYRRRIFFKV